ncbi:hypothetical protein H9P43_005008 [Blastocladiella emersonii ATCC 22665]|nr:hypothetical protein H9P43_005008 [Blastocladiella emersonii ATCC 22665]
MSDSEDYANDPPQRGALPVALYPVGDPSLPPVSGEEYLRRVREESRALGPVRVVAPRPDLFPAATDDSVDDAPPSGFPQPDDPAPTLDRAWADRTLAEFTRLHARLLATREARVPRGPGGIAYTNSTPTLPPVPSDLAALAAELPAAPRARPQDWHAFLYGGAGQHGGFGSPPLDAGARAVWRPSMLLRLSHRSLVAVLVAHRYWITPAMHPAALVVRAKTIYCLLAALEPLLTTDDVSGIREMAKRCAAVMRALEGRQGEGEEDAVRQDAVAGLGIVLLIASQHLGQKDLCELV